MKKLSKRLLAMLLVAVMVVAAIPFGAFAETITVEEPITVVAVCGSTEVGHGQLPALTGYDHTKDQANALLYGNVALEGYTLDASKPSVLDESTTPKTLKVFVTKDPEYSVVVTGDATATGANKLETIDAGTPADYGKLYQAMTDAGLSEYLDTDKWTITAAALGGKVLTVTVAKKDEAPAAPEKFDYSVVVTGDATATGANKLETIDAGTPTDYGKLYQAMTDAGLSEYLDTDKWTITAAALDGKVLTVTVAKKDEAPAAPEKFDYTVSIWTTGNLQLAESKTVSMTEAAAEAIKTNAKQAIEVNFPSVYNDLTVSALNGATATVDHSARTIRLVVDKQPTAESHDDEIHVVLSSGHDYWIKKKDNVGNYYSQVLSQGNTWGSKQTLLLITDANGIRTVKWDSRDNDAKVRQTDSEVKILNENKTVTIYYLKSSTSNPTTTNAHATRKYEYNTQLGTLPDLPTGYDTWYVNGVPLDETTVYRWETDYVYAYPGNGQGTGRVHLFIYNNNKGLMKNVDVTDNVQADGMITRAGLLKTIEYQTGYKNPSLAGLFDEDGWAYYLNHDKSTLKAQSGIFVQTAEQREGTYNIYVVLTGVSGGSNADSSNPKTGDTAMIGTAAVVMALAVVGMGTAFYMKKREMI